MTNSLENLPPELQARIAQIMAGGGQAAATTPAPANVDAPQAQPDNRPNPLRQPPSLMDHVVALRQEVAAMRQEMLAVAQVTDAVGNAVGAMYAMFQQTPEPTNQSSTYSQSFQQSVDDEF